jgi:hypothetical protein
MGKRSFLFSIFNFKNKSKPGSKGTAKSDQILINISQSGNY